MVEHSVVVDILGVPGELPSVNGQIVSPAYFHIQADSLKGLGYPAGKQFHVYSL